MLFSKRGRTAVLAFGLAACGSEPAAQTASSAAPSAPPPAHRLTTVAEGLSTPWSVAFVPDGSLLVTERAGRLRVIRDGHLEPDPVAGVPPVYAEGQGGLFDVALHPGFETNRLVYLAYASGTSEENATRVARARFDGKKLEDLEVIFEASPKKATTAHFGGRLLFLPDATLLVTLGDGFVHREKAQSLEADFGKIVRIRDDGSIPDDNPFVGTDTARPEIYSFGHRNVQGIVRDPRSGRIYAHEHGPKGGDELNLLEPGKNYGWPVITYGRDYSGAIISPYTEKPGMEQPLVYWVPSIAPSGMTLYDGERFPEWRGDLLVSALAGTHVRRIDLEEGAVVGQQELFRDLGARIRDVRTAPDGSLYLLTDGEGGRVIRVDPGA